MSLHWAWPKKDERKGNRGKYLSKTEIWKKRTELNDQDIVEWSVKKDIHLLILKGTEVLIDGDVGMKGAEDDLKVTWNIN